MSKRRENDNDRKDVRNDFITETELMAMITDEYNPTTDTRDDRVAAEERKLAAASVSTSNRNTSNSRTSESGPAFKDQVQESGPSFKDQVHECDPNQQVGSGSTGLHHEDVTNSIVDNDLRNFGRKENSSRNNRLPNNHRRVGAVPIRGPGAVEEEKVNEDDRVNNFDQIDVVSGQMPVEDNSLLGNVTQNSISQQTTETDCYHENVEVATTSIMQENLVNAYVVKDDPVVVAINAELITKDDERDRIKKEELEEKIRQMDQQNKLREQSSQKRKCMNRFLISSLVVIIGIVVVVTVYYSMKDDDDAKGNNSTENSDVPKFQSFTSTDELYEAVDSFLLKRNPEASIEARTYGYPMGNWDVSKITNFSRVFDANGRSSVFNVTKVNNLSTFNEDISNWNVSSATTMYGMFASAVNFNQDISKWDTSRVTDMSCMFTQAWSFNQNLTRWDVSKVTITAYMFYRAMGFTGDVSTWDTRNVKNMSHMFAWSTMLPNNTRYKNWNTSSVVTMKSMFWHAELWDSPDLGSWDVSNVEDMSQMVAMTSRFQSSDLGNWNVSKVKDMSKMFHNASAYNHDLSKWDVSSVQKLDMMFQDAIVFKQDLCPWSDKIFHSTGLSSTSPNTTDMFLNSACANQSDPVDGAGISWCQSCS